MGGPLEGIRVLELAGTAPGPFGAMVLADLGAEVLRVDRVRDARLSRATVDVLGRGRRSVAVDLKAPAGPPLVRRLAARADVLVEGYRPGVMERLGLGPADLHADNPRLVYARMTGWGQDGPMATRAGHDINYIAASGALEPLGRPGQNPHAPANLLGDFAGGGLLLVVGVLAALVERERSGQGQVIDVAMVDGSALLTAYLHGLKADGYWGRGRGENLLDGGAPFYDTYLTADGGYLALGALERRFYAELLDGLGLADEDLPDQMDRRGWPRLRERFAEVIATRTRAEWTEIFADRDACVCAVLSLDEAPHAAHAAARDGFVTLDGIRQPAPAPRFDRTPAPHPEPAPLPGEHTAQALADWGVSEDELAALEAAGAIAGREPAETDVQMPAAL